jgi:MoaA/NifB/PqqE/SkfB family radical SAM enzyme
MPQEQFLDRISIELTNECQKQCWFCYNQSHAKGKTSWLAEEVITLVLEGVQHGLKSVSFGGGDPLHYEPLVEVLQALSPHLFTSLTTHGLLLNQSLLQSLVQAPVHKIQLSIHFPEKEQEVRRVFEQVSEIKAQGIWTGINLVVSQSNFLQAAKAAQSLRSQGISNREIIYLPLRIQDTPTPQQMAFVAGTPYFQSMSCFLQCGKSPRFCSLSWDKKVAWCSYTSSKIPLKSLNYQGILESLESLDLQFCGKNL